MKIAICGGPRTGKSTLAQKLRQELPLTYVSHSDDLIGQMEWWAISEKIASDMANPDFTANQIWEGVRITHSLRKFLSLYPDKPADKIYRLTSPFVPLSKGQMSMLKSDQTIWSEIKHELVRRGVELL